MDDQRTQNLRDCLQRLPSVISGIARLNERCNSLPPLAQDSALQWIVLYDELCQQLETAMWQQESPFDELLLDYQALFREQANLVNTYAADSLHEFILCIPVADRPAHLRECLHSIHENCRLFGYGGTINNRFARIRVIIAEDSRDPRHVQQHIELAQEFTAKGLDTQHLNFAEQYRLLQQIPPIQRDQLGNLLSRQPLERFYHKGQAANRNIAYLKLREITRDTANTLYYLVDSDQYFKLPHPTQPRSVYALNYFHYINRIFKHNKIHMLTGKLVGDPPVSPSVMAVNFLEDVIAFFTQLSTKKSDAACDFHPRHSAPVDDAAYHDMADFFGYQQKQMHFDYPCPLRGPHDHSDCLTHFSARLNAFFFGEHLTRKTSFVHRGEFTRITPARTIYPGNYVVDFDGLKYIIPFGHLRLRMSGPTAGRLIQAEIGDAFVSANMPMLHGRTSLSDHTEDFRPGVELDAWRIDLSDEFERQFFGDLMLFSVAELVQRSPPNTTFCMDTINDVIERIEVKLLHSYANKHQAVLHRVEALSQLISDQSHWWRAGTCPHTALTQIQHFIDNMRFNFGEESRAWQQIQSSVHRQHRQQQITDALQSYHAERSIWDQLISTRPAPN